MARHIPPDDRRCTAKSKTTGERCKNYRYPGKKVCRYHGGLSPGGKKGNKNAVTTGQYESIFLDTLTPDEQEVFQRIKTDKLEAIEEQIRLGLIRERRMMQRIADLIQVDFTVVERTYEKGVGAKPDGEYGGDISVRVNKQTAKSRATLGQVQNIEEALTRVQAQVRQLIATKHQIETGVPPDGDELDRLFANMRRSRQLTDQGDEDGD